MVSDRYGMPVGIFCGKVRANLAGDSCAAFWRMGEGLVGAGKHCRCVNIGAASLRHACCSADTCVMGESVPMCSLDMCILGESVCRSEECVDEIGG